MLEASAADLAADYGASLTIKAVHGLYEDGLALLASDPAFCDLPKLVLFLGSSIGNLDYNDAAVFLRDTGRTMVPSRDAFLVGMDFAKDPAVLEAAYDDAAGVTARFNLNVLTRINNDLGAGTPLFSCACFVQFTVLILLLPYFCVVVCDGQGRRCHPFGLPTAKYQRLSVHPSARPTHKPCRL